MTEVISNSKCFKSCVVSKIDLLMNSLSKFYANEDNINTLLPIVQGCSKISLRVLDWFVTNYCKKYNIIINDNGKKVIVHLDYKNQLKAYSKKQFDPFCRRSRINFIYGNGDELLTTVGQLNFFRWAIENHIVEYIEENLEDIEKDMNQSIKSNNTKDEELQKGKRRRKRQELSISASKSVSKHNVKITVEFS